MLLSMILICRSGLIKQLGRSKEGDGEERISRISDRGLSGEWEIVDHPDASKSSPDVAKKPPPPVASKPKPSAPEPGSGGGIGEEQNTGSANSSPKKMPGMVAMAPMNELANVLKGVALKPKVPPLALSLSLSLTHTHIHNTHTHTHTHTHIHNTTHTHTHTQGFYLTHCGKLINTKMQRP